MTSLGKYNPITFNREHVTMCAIKEVVRTKGMVLESCSETFVDKQIVISLLKEREAVEASQYGDPECKELLAKNDNDVWESFLCFKRVNGRGHNATTYGNVALAICYVSLFPERRPIAKKLIRVLKKA